MKAWMGALALGVALAWAAAPALAQGPSGAGSSSGDTKGSSPSATGTDTKTGAGPDTKATSPSASPSDTKAQDATKPSDTMKSDTDSMKGDRAAKGGRGGASMSVNADQVRALQQALKDQGYDPGDIDGKMGPKTQAALRDYQQKQGLKATGRPDAETLAKLGVDAKTSSGASTSSPAASPSTSAPSDTKADTGKSDSKTDTSAKPSTGTKQPK